MSYIVLTNNSLVKALLKKSANEAFAAGEIIYKEVSFLEILRKARELIVKGNKLVCHPFMGNLAPYETYYKTLVFRRHDEEEVIDFESLNIIKTCINVTERAVSQHSQAFLTDNEKFRRSDLALCECWMSKENDNDE